MSSFSITLGSGPKLVFQILLLDDTILLFRGVDAYPPILISNWWEEVHNNNNTFAKNFYLEFNMSYKEPPISKSLP